MSVSDDHRVSPALFTRAQCRSLGRCETCCWHPPTQGHHESCPRRDEGDDRDVELNTGRALARAHRRTAGRR
ncbi:hypothetical protein EXE63_00735 (plasmid) [Mycolicibacterium frederiksbergense]|uniref:Uncharacterized protein n=1 Tax=Mycolicibacterium frederiksbergense TaxID=117567 RepID=A0A6H0RZV6_9MYCO|nr:hypothetical protein EXE63_00735 [Mycolicibacterium frederiksbergense]